MTDVVTTLTIDGRQAEQGAAVYARAMRQGAQSTDVLVAANDRLQQATDRTGITLTRETDRIARVASQWDRLRGSVDQVAQAEIRMHNEVERASRTADTAVKRGIATQEEAARVVELVRVKYAGLLSEARGAATATAAAATAQDQAAAAAGRNYQALVSLGRAEADALSQRLRVSQAYQASITPVDTTTAAVKRNYQASIEAGRAQADELAQRQRVRQAYEASLNPMVYLTNATKTGAEATKLSAHQLQNLSFQLNDVVSGLVTGQRPLQVLAQQGPQITQVFGGVGATFAAVRASIAAIGAPILAAVAGFTLLTVAMAIGLTRAAELDRQLKSLRTSLAITGNASGLNPVAVQAQVNAFATQPGVSRASATSAADALLRNPDITADLFQRALPTLRDWAKVTGEDIPAAAKSMSSALLGGYDAAMNLQQAYRLLTPEELDEIRRLEEMGRKADGANIILAAMERRWRGLADITLTDAERAANNLGNAWDRLMDRVGRSGPINAARDALIGLLDLASGERTVRARTTTAALTASGAAGQGVAYWLSVFGLISGGSTDSGRGAGALAGGTAPAADPTVTSMKAMADQARILRDALDPVPRALEKIKNTEQQVTEQFLAGLIPLDAYARMLRNLEGQRRALPTQQSFDQQQDRAILLAGMTPWQRAGEEAAQRARDENERGGSVDVERARRKAQQEYWTGRYQAFGQSTLQPLTIEAQAAGAVADAYARSEAEGRKAELRLRALVSQYELGEEAVDAYTQALIEQDAAQRRIAGARELRALRDEVEDLEKLTDALSGSTAEYERQRIAVEAQRRQAQGFFTPEQAQQYADLQLRKLRQDLAREAVQTERQFNPQAQFAADVAKLNDLAGTGKLSAEAYRKAWEDAFIRSGQASDSWIRGATAGLLEYARQAQQVGGAVADAIVRSLGAADDAIAKLLLRRSVDLRQFIADVSLDLTRAFVRQTITGPIASFFGSLFNGGGSPVLAGGGATFSSGGIGGLLGGSGGSNPLSLLGGGFNPFGIFGQGGSLGSFLQTPLFGAGGVFGSSLASAGTSLGGILGSVGGGGLTVANGLGALGGVASGIFNIASGNPIAGVGSLIGAGVSLIPGIGQVAGPIISIASSLLGGLLKSKPTYRSQAMHTYNPATGGYDARTVFEENMKAVQAPGVGNDALKLISAFGGSVSPGMSAPDYYIWRGFKDGLLDATVTAESSPTYRALLEKAWASGQVKTTEEAQWAARTELWTDAPVNGEWRQLPINAPTTDSSTLMQQLALLILKAGVRDNVFTGLSDTSQKIIRNFPDADTQGLAQALQWGKSTYDVLVRTDTITAAEKALTDLRDSFQAAIQTAKDYGLATDKLVEAQTRAINKYATDFGQNIEDQLLGLQDPAALQRVQVERAREQALQEWDYLNQQYLDGQIDTLIDRNKINELYDQQLLQITSQSVTDLQDLWKRLTYGDLSSASPAVTLAGARGAYQNLLAAAQAGDSSALAQLSGAAADYINAQRAYTGNDSRFEDTRLSVSSDIAPWVASNANPAITGAVGLNAQSSEGIAQLIVAIQQEREENAELKQQVADLTRTVERLLGKMAA